MKWDQDAELMMRAVPFFVRKRVRKRVEEYALSQNRNRVSPKDVEATKKRFLDRQEEEITGYQLDTCFGSGGCPHTVCDTGPLQEALTRVLKSHKIREFLKSRIRGPLKFHHEFKVAIAGCPNGCSQPQIRDVGILAVTRPAFNAEACSGCRRCTAVCPDNAMFIEEEAVGFRGDLCMDCGRCIPVCHEGALTMAETGYRILLGGRLGRHPRLGVPLSGIYGAEETAAIVSAAISFWKEQPDPLERFAKMFRKEDAATILENSKSL